MMINQENKILNDVDKIITTNQTLKNKLVNEGYADTKIKVIHNGVDSALFTPNHETGVQLRTKNNIHEGDIVIGYIGTIALYEGIEYILKCIKTFDNDNIKFLLIGDGIYKNEILNLVESYGIQKNVIYLGKINHREIMKYYNMIDIVAYPRKNFDLCKSTPSYKILEAMAMEKPIIVPTNCDSYNEIIINDENGLYFEQDNVDDLLQKIKSLIEDKELRNRLGKNAREWVIKNRDWTNISQELRDLYDELSVC